MLYSILILFMDTFFRLFLVKDINGIKNMPKNACIIASNHVSYLDPPILGSVISKNLNKKIHFLAKIELFKSFLSRAAQKVFESIPVDREKKDNLWIKSAKKYIKNDHIIGIFPEGERSRSGKLQKGKTGVIRLALAANAPIVPVGIIGTYYLLPMNKRFPKIKRIVKINIGKPIYYGQYYRRKITKSLLRRLTDNLMLEIGKLTVK